MITKITGMGIYKYKTPLIGDVINIDTEPDNEFDGKAVVAHYKGAMVGYIPKDTLANKWCHRNKPVIGKVVDLAWTTDNCRTWNREGDGRLMSIKIELQKDNTITSDFVPMKSICEDVVINFSERAHKYDYNGQILTSATTFLKQFKKPFESKIIADKCEKLWKVKSKDIQAMWSSGGNMAAGYGTAIHNALEHYFKYKKQGEVIVKNSKKTENPAYPKHPELKKIIEDFEKIDNFKGDHLVEALVSNVELGLCGLVDRILVVDKKKKICRVQDYKIIDDLTKNGEKLLKQFESMAPNKLSYYNLQLEFYARLLELGGWTVEGLDIYAYTGKGWKYYEVERIEGPFNK